MLPFTGNKNLILNWVLKPDLERQTFRGIQKNSNLKFWTLNSLDIAVFYQLSYSK